MDTIVTAPVTEIMTRDVISAQESNSLNKLVDLFKKHHIRHIPICKDGVVTGIVSRTDINRLTFGALFDEEEATDDAILTMLSIPQIMSINPKTVKPSASIKEVAEIFTKAEYHALPVVDKNKIVGIVTTTDIIKFMLRND